MPAIITAESRAARFGDVPVTQQALPTRCSFHVPHFCSNRDVPQHVLVPGVAPPQVQGFAFPLVELHEAPVSTFLKLVEVLLDGSTTLRGISHSCQFCLICKLAVSTLCPIVQIINKGVEQDWTQC